MAHHKDLTGVDLHEPKGVASASANQVYVADGLGSGAWTTQKASVYSVARDIADVSTAGSFYISVPKAGTISFITAVLDGAITVADAILTFQINGVAIDTSQITVAFTGSAAGSDFNSTPTGHNTVAAGDVIKITTDGGSTTAAVCHVELLINVS